MSKNKKCVRVQGEDFSFTFKLNGDKNDPASLVEIITHNRGGFYNTLTFRDLSFKQLKQLANFFNNAADQVYDNTSW